MNNEECLKRLEFLGKLKFVTKEDCINWIKFDGVKKILKILPSTDDGENEKRVVNKATEIFEQYALSLFDMDSNEEFVFF
jgi:hypothetical protein